MWVGVGSLACLHFPSSDVAGQLLPLLASRPTSALVFGEGDSHNPGSVLFVWTEVGSPRIGIWSGPQGQQTKMRVAPRLAVLT